MQFGVCGGPEIGRLAKAAGYDYFESSVGGLLHPREPEEVFQDALAEVRAVGLACPVVNVFLPGDLKVTGPEVDPTALEQYISTALHRAETAGVQRIVFGSGAARRVPDSFDRTWAWAQLVEFGFMLAALAERHGVTIAVEPLNLSETNILNTVSEAAQLVRVVDHPAFRLLVDGYHWARDNDSLAGIVENGDLLVHAHVATVDGRRPPRPGDDCAAFFAALREADYDGRVSIEGQIDHPAEELPRALEIMRGLAFEKPL